MHLSDMPGRQCLISKLKSVIIGSIAANKQLSASHMGLLVLILAAVCAAFMRDAI
jgi:hypothetical protein